ncbi:hypothetical protein VTO73DRAFT_469 [Trametes versicolor]
MLVVRRGKAAARSKALEPTTNALSLLPIEIWILVLREAQYDDLLPRYRWLRRYCLVCKSWSPHAQQLLFAHVALRGSTHCKAFKKAIRASAQHNPEHTAALCRSVRTIQMVIDHQEIYAGVVQLCPALRELHLCMYHAAFRPDALARLAQLPSTVRALRVRAYHYTALFQLLALFPNIEYLEVDCSGIPGPLPDPLPPPPAWRLRELRYFNPRRATQGFVEWALSGPGAGSRDMLEALRVQCPTFSPSILAELGLSRLRSLAVPRVLAGDDLAILNHIEEIWMTAPRYPTPTFRRLPTGLRHLALHPLSETVDCEAVTADLVAYYENSDGLLEVVTYHRRYDDDDESVEDIQMLHQFCKERGITFRLMDPLYGYYAGERIPFEPVTSCPRDMPLSSRRLIVSQSKLDAILKMPRKKPTFTRKMARSAKRAFENIHPAYFGKM